MDCDHHLSSTWFLDFIILVRIIRAVLQRLPLSSSRDRHHYSSLYLLPDYHVHHKRYYSIYYKLIDEKYEEYITIIIFMVMLSTVGGPLIMMGFLLLGYISQQESIAYLDLAWYDHFGYFIAIILVLKTIFNASRTISNFFVSLFSQ